MTTNKRECDPGEGESATKRPKISSDPSEGDSSIPICAGFRGPPGSIVVVSEDGYGYNARLHLARLEGNNNRFSHLQLLIDPHGRYWVVQRSGRCGENLRTKEKGPFRKFQAAKRNFDTTYKNKTGLWWNHRDSPSQPKKFVRLDESYDAVVTLQQPTKHLIELIFNQECFDDMIYSRGFDPKQGFSSMLGEKSIERGYNILEKLAALIQSRAENRKASQDVEIQQLTNAYYSTIPHPSGWKPLPLIKDEKQICEEIGGLDKLRDMAAADKSIRKSEGMSMFGRLQTLYKELRTEIEPLDHNSQEFVILRDYFLGSALYNSSVRDIFRVERDAEKGRFELADESMALKRPRRLLLWHGTFVECFGGILSEGLRIPFIGRSFGRGIYFADMSHKSGAYCGNLGAPNPKIPCNSDFLMLLCEVEVGSKMFELVKGAQMDSEIDCKSRGLVAIKGLGITEPRAWMDAGQVNSNLAGVFMPDMSKGVVKDHRRFLSRNEYIVYKGSQVKIRYIFRIKR